MTGTNCCLHDLSCWLHNALPEKRKAVFNSKVWHQRCQLGPPKRRALNGLASIWHLTPLLGAESRRNLSPGLDLGLQAADLLLETPQVEWAVWAVALKDMGLVPGVLKHLGSPTSPSNSSSGFPPKKICKSSCFLRKDPRMCGPEGLRSPKPRPHEVGVLQLVPKRPKCRRHGGDLDGRKRRVSVFELVVRESSSKPKFWGGETSRKPNLVGVALKESHHFRGCPSLRYTHMRVACQDRIHPPVQFKGSGGRGQEFRLVFRYKAQERVPFQAYTLYFPLRALWCKLADCSWRRLSSSCNAR